MAMTNVIEKKGFRHQVSGFRYCRKHFAAAFQAVPEA
jgi:hypothetical protein